MTKITTSPYIALDSLLEGVIEGNFRPEHVLSLSEIVINRVHDLSPEYRALFVECIQETYSEIKEYARGSAFFRVKEVA